MTCYNTYSKRTLTCGVNVTSKKDKIPKNKNHNTISPKFYKIALGYLIPKFSKDFQILTVFDEIGKNTNETLF